MTIEVLLEYGIKKNEGIFTYTVPKEFEQLVKVGKRVLVPLNNKKVVGFILNIYHDKKYDFPLKDIDSIIDGEAILNKELLELGNYISDTTLAPLINSYQVMFPSGYKASHKQTINIKEKSFIVLNKTIDEINDYISHNKYEGQNEILRSLINLEEIPRAEIKSASLKTLLDKGLVALVKKEEYRLQSAVKDYPRHQLTDKQAHVVSEVIAKSNIYQTFLLHGVTGSGKTEVYLQIIDSVLASGKNVIVLVPEISLTPQMVERFVGRFGSLVAILHSRLSDGERFDEFRKILRGEVRIVVGARSAIFAPLANIGLIVIDEEHEASYKQDSMNPKYHAISIAKQRALYHQCPLILGSATPSLESYAHASKGLYQLLVLDERINKSLPQVTVVNMLDEFKKRHFIFSRILEEKISLALAKKEQVILLLNRRGYSSYFMCGECGFIHKCPNCDISLTYHKNSDMMRCHYCNYATKKINECPSCHSNKIIQIGMGTEKIEEELINTFKARVVRMDYDTTSTKGAHSQILNDFKEHKYDILLGTQMIAKGLDFDNVTLVGVINSDLSLNLPDFRSSERTYQLLSQVAGRAGRSKLVGEVIIQTFNPEHYSIKFAKEHNYLGFYNHEMMIRRKLKYSPFYYLTLIKVSSRDYEEALKQAKKIKAYLEARLGDNVIALGPVAASVYKINNIYRFQIILKYKDERLIIETLKEMPKTLNDKVNIDIDINALQV